MKALAIAARDTSAQLQEVTQPEAAAGQVLVGVDAASVNGFDLSVAAGYVWDMLPHEFPVVLGRDFVGTVTGVGDRVGQVAVGDRVAGVIPGVALGPVGAFAEQVTVPASAVAALPAGVAVQDAAAVGLAGVAAVDALAALQVEPGDTVLVSGATGGVGSLAVQLATAAGDPAAIGQVLRAGGQVASLRSATAEQVGRDDVTVTGILADATADKLTRLLADLADGKLKVNVEAAVPLERADQAMQAFTSGKLGKVLVTR